MIIEHVSGESIPMDHIKGLLLDLVSYLDSICRRYNLRYSLAYGTLLGAVRHKGFIPWDDDIDVLMPRPDYNKFIKIINHKDYKLLSQDSDTEWPLNYAKLCDIRTTSIDQFGNKFPIAVDLFVLDGLGDSEAEAHKIVERIHVMHRLWSSQRFTCRLPYKLNCGLKKNCLILGAKIIHPFCPLDKYVKKMLAYKQHLDIDNSCYCASLTGICTIFKTEKMLNYVDIPFEDRTLRINEDYDYQLRTLFGDYMQIPPENERVNHGSVAYWV